jgi:hypothetical protein
MQISKLKVGSRFRRDVGDVRSLASSIAAIGLIHPIVADARGHLVAGTRRLAAVKALGWRDVPVRVVRSLSDAANGGALLHGLQFRGRASDAPRYASESKGASQITSGGSTK